MLRWLSLLTSVFFLSACVTLNVPQLPWVDSALTSSVKKEAWLLSYSDREVLMSATPYGKVLRFVGQRGEWAEFDGSRMVQVAGVDADSTIYSWVHTETDETQWRLLSGIREITRERCAPSVQLDGQRVTECVDQRHKIRHFYRVWVDALGNLTKVTFPHPISKALITLQRHNPSESLN